MNLEIESALFEASVPSVFDGEQEASAEGVAKQDPSTRACSVSLIEDDLVLDRSLRPNPFERLSGSNKGKGKLVYPDRSGTCAS